MGRTIWFLTTNQGKVEEARDHVSGYGYDIQQLVVPGVELVEPQTDDLVTVAKAKIEQAVPHLPNPDDLLLVEDAGLFVQALHGFPGVYSAHALKTIECQGMIRLLSHLHCLSATRADAVNDVDQERDKHHCPLTSTDDTIER